MKLKTLKSIKNLVAEKNRTLPILDCLKIENGHVHITNLEFYVKAMHSFPIDEDSDPIVVNANHFIQRLEHIRSPYIVNCKEGQIKYSHPGNENTIMRSDSIIDFPEEPKDEIKVLFSISAYEISILNVAAQFTADDQLRPVMEAVCIDDNFIVASDAHKLYYKKINKLGDKQVLLHPKCIKLMMLYPGMTFEVAKCGNWLCLFNVFITIYWRGKDLNEYLFNSELTGRAGKYPNWQSVVPVSTHDVIIPVKESLEVLKAIKFAVNPATGLVRCKVKKDKLIFSGKDLDYGLSSSESVDIINKDKSEIEFGLKFTFIQLILQTLYNEGCTQVKMGLTEPSLAIVFNGQILLMPMMINE